MIQKKNYELKKDSENERRAIREAVSEFKK
jgi:hypothetical protein